MQTFWLAAIIFTFSTGSILAAGPGSENFSYWTKAKRKFHFGLKNMLFGSTQLFHKPAQAAEEHRNILIGLGEGLWCSVADTVGGAINLATFWYPVTLPLPKDGIQITECKSCVS